MTAGGNPPRPRARGFRTGYSANPTGNTFGQIQGTTGGQRSLRFGARFVF